MLSTLGVPGFKISDPLKTCSTSRQLCPAKFNVYIAKFNAKRKKEKREEERREKEKKKKQTHSMKFPIILDLNCKVAFESLRKVTL